MVLVSPRPNSLKLFVIKKLCSFAGIGTVFCVATMVLMSRGGNEPGRKQAAYDSAYLGPGLALPF